MSHSLRSWSGCLGLLHKLSLVFWCSAYSGVMLAGESAWNQSYSAGFHDTNGAWAGGSEIMHLVSHKGKVYAANGYWVDSKWVIPPDGQKQSAQVL